MDGKVITRSAEERQAEAEALHASIVEQVEQRADSGQWRAFLEFARSFHNYSLNNLLLILAQDSTATMVAGFRQWQAKVDTFAGERIPSRSSGTGRRRGSETTKQAMQPRARRDWCGTFPPSPFSTSPRPTRSKGPRCCPRIPPDAFKVATTTVSSLP
ncbi:hypothetical protein [Leifsonia poae]|uniref:hypothetical protein n=1 Tax=Leifsonia poae TaxID=110933 RepID=UPI003D66D867